ncbi:MAG TPA: hypothetical protein VLJ38_06875, partial [Polyangiaceae bacterium]|nr:hypothetical protein [Polyangiaceae bacterium]
MLAPAANGAWAKFHRIVRRAAWALGSALAASFVLGASLLLYLQSASGRRFLAKQVSELVSGELASELRIERLDVISSRRLVASRAVLTDARGRILLAVDGLAAEFELSSLLAHVLFGAEVRVVVPEVRADRLEVGLYRDAHGELVLAHAFDTAKPRTKTKATRPLRLRLPHVLVRSASVHNDEPELARATTELGELTAKLEVAPGLFELGLDTRRLRIAGALPVALEGALQGQLRIPGQTEASFSGALGSLPLSARFEMHGDELDLRASSSSLTPEGMKKLVPAWPLLLPV